MLQGRVNLLPGTELRPVSFNKRQQNEEAFFQKHLLRAHVSPMFPSFPYGNHCFQCQFWFPRCKLGLRCTGGNFNENPSMRAVVKILLARASEHSSNFASNSSKGQILRALSIDTPYRPVAISESSQKHNFILFSQFTGVLEDKN